MSAEQRVAELVKRSKDESLSESERQIARNQLRELTTRWPSNRDIRTAGSAAIR